MSDDFNGQWHRQPDKDLDAPWERRAFRIILIGAAVLFVFALWGWHVAQGG